MAILSVFWEVIHTFYDICSEQYLQGVIKNIDFQKSYDGSWKKKMKKKTCDNDMGLLIWIDKLSFFKSPILDPLNTGGLACY